MALTLQSGTTTTGTSAVDITQVIAFYSQVLLANDGPVSFDTEIIR